MLLSLSLLNLLGKLYICNFLAIASKLKYKKILLGGDLTTTTTLATILSDIGSFVTSAITWIGDFVDCIVENKLLLAFVIVAFVGLGVGLIKRIIRL